MASVVRAEIDIQCNIDRVWEILRDLESYPEWNPFTPRVESSLRVGDPVHLYAKLRGTKLTHRVETVSAAEPYRLCWGMTMGARSLLEAERSQVLTAIDERRTHYVTEDRLSGLLTPLVMGLFGGPMQRGFADCARALKQRAES